MLPGGAVPRASAQRMRWLSLVLHGRAGPNLSTRLGGPVTLSRPNVSLLRGSRLGPWHSRPRKNFSAVAQPARGHHDRVKCQRHVVPPSWPGMSRVKPGHDVGPAMTWGARVGFSSGWYYTNRL